MIATISMSVIEFLCNEVYTSQSTLFYCCIIIVWWWLIINYKRYGYLGGALLCIIFSMYYHAYPNTHRYLYVWQAMVNIINI